MSVPPRVRRPILLGAILVILGGCATSSFGTDADARAADDVPDHFLVGRPGPDATAEPTPGDGCRNPMVDPRDGTRLQLVRSSDNRGDYAVPEGRYGVAEGELLRLDCGTGAAVGVVRR
jgi:hypothetical protein